jgi:hypothetical protein
MFTNARPLENLAPFLRGVAHRLFARATGKTAKNLGKTRPKRFVACRSETGSIVPPCVLPIRRRVSLKKKPVPSS